MAEESCDHSGCSASSVLLELRDLKSNVYQGSQHNLYKEITHTHTKHMTSCSYAVLTHPLIQSFSQTDYRDARLFNIEKYC